MKATDMRDIVGYNFANGIDLRKPLGWVGSLPSPEVDVDETHLATFFEIMKERQKIWVRRSLLGKPAPWTKNPILRDYKYTNVYRELDRASQFMTKHILTQDMSIEQKLFKLMVFRFYNQPDSFKQNGGLVDLPDYDRWAIKINSTGETAGARKIWVQTVAQRQKANPWHVAYMMNMAFAPKLEKPWSKPGLYKDWAYTHIVFNAVHKMIPGLVTVLDQAKKPEEIIECLETIPAVSTFQSYEFFLDFTYFARYSSDGSITQFTANDYVNIGPGASLGLRLIFPSMLPKDQLSGLELLTEIAEEQFGDDFPYLMWDSERQKYYTTNEYKYGVNFDKHSIEFYLCEFSKYWKMSIKQGKQRSKFRPHV